MCIIIINPKSEKLPNGVAKRSAKKNPDGLGITWLDTFETSYHLSKEYKILENSKRPFIAHFRYATIGKVCKENTHPFVCGKNQQELLMMNGTIMGLGNKELCDSRVLAMQIGDKPRHTWKEVLEKYDSRFVTINTRNKTYQIYNKHLWTQRDGIWYSKDNVLQTNLVAVYGTLKKNESNYYHYLYNAQFVGSGKTNDKYPLIIKGLPYLINDIGVGHNVEVDIFRVSDANLVQLDRLEGHPNWYRREQIPVTCNGKTYKCWVYFNLVEKVNGQKMHKTYKGYSSKRVIHSPSIRPNYVEPRRKTYDDYMKDYPMHTIKPSTIWDDEENFDDSDFDVLNEKPICVGCSNDLAFDGFANYYCSSCGGWFGEDEIIRFR